MDSHSGEQEASHDRDASFDIHSGKQEMTHDRENNFNVPSGKQETTHAGEMNFHPGAQEMTPDSMRGMRGLCEAYRMSIGCAKDVYITTRDY